MESMAALKKKNKKDLLKCLSSLRGKVATLLLYERRKIKD